MATQTDAGAVEQWPGDEEERALRERLRAVGVRLSTQSGDRPRELVKRRPAWLAFLLTLVRVRA